MEGKLQKIFSLKSTLQVSFLISKAIHLFRSQWHFPLSGLTISHNSDSYLKGVLGVTWCNLTFTAGPSSHRLVKTHSKHLQRQRNNHYYEEPVPLFGYTHCTSSKSNLNSLSPPCIHCLLAFFFSLHTISTNSLALHTCSLGGWRQQSVTLPP